jgi:2,3-bisphosphoglycerate-independent phosphoglycerate mutase
MDRVAREGRLGHVLTVPDGFVPATDVATLTLFGYDPHKYYSGRAPLEALARKLAVRADHMVFRCNFVTVLDGRMRDFTGGHITQPEADALVAALCVALRPLGCELHTGVSYRNLLLLSNGAEIAVKCAPPHDIADELVTHHLPSGDGGSRVQAIMDAARAVIAEHPVNAARHAGGRSPVTDIWLWGQGRPTNLETFEARFGLRGAVVTAVDILRGIAVGMGMDLIEVPGATGYIDTDYAAKGRAAVKALVTHDVVVVHIEAADEAGHMGNATEKVKAIERIDADVVGPVIDALPKHGEWRMLVAPDHPTPVRTKGHSATPPPFCFTGTGVSPGSGRGFTEAEAHAAGLFVERGPTLIEMFLGRG